MVTGSDAHKLTVLDEEPGAFRFCAFSNITIITWHAQATGPAVARLERVTATIDGLHHKGFSAIHLVRGGVQLPTKEAREGFLRILNTYADRLRCISVVLTEGGFWAGALRGFVTGLSLVAPRSLAFRVFSSIEELATELPQRHLEGTGVIIDSEGLARAMHAALADGGVTLPVALY